MTERLDVQYSTWDSVATSNPSWVQYYLQNSDGNYEIYIGHADYIFVATADGADKTAFEANHKTGATSVPSYNEAKALYVGLSVPRRPANSRGANVIQLMPPEASRLDLITPNWCDRTTWVDQSLEIDGETLTDSGDGLTFNSAHANWIDTGHGRITDENKLDTKYRPIVKDNGVIKTEDDPFGGTQNDYSINYATGSVTFHSAPTGPVTADYWYESGSLWTLKPAAGKIIRLTAVEVQFSENVVMNDTVQFQVYVGGSPYGSPVLYKRFTDFVNAAEGSYPSIPAMAGAQRGTNSPIRVFRWPYKERGTTDLKASLAMEIRISLLANNAFGGEFGTATFYGVTEDE